MRKVIYNKFFTVCITTVLVIFIFCLNSCQRSIGESDSKHDSSTNGIKVLFDTDIGGDVDDVGALVILNNYVNQGKVELLAVGVCAYNPYSPGVIDSVCQYYGNTDVRIGQFDFNDEQIDYADKKLDIYSKPLYYDYYNRFSAGDEKPEQVIDMYRELLEKADDKSVVFISVGFLNNLYDLLESEPDKISPLTGRQLIQKKVNKLVCMGGCFSPSGNEQKHIIDDMELDVFEYCEFNVSKWPKASKAVAEDWPTKKVFVGFEAGLVKCGSGLKKYDNSNPARMAYARYTIEESLQRYSWDPITVLYACEENNNLFEVSAPGYVSFDENGRTVFRKSDNGDSQYLIWKESGEMIARELNEILSADAKYYHR